MISFIGVDILPVFVLFLLQSVISDVLHPSLRLIAEPATSRLHPITDPKVLWCFPKRQKKERG